MTLKLVTLLEGNKIPGRNPHIIYQFLSVGETKFNTFHYFSPFIKENEESKQVNYGKKKFY
jgi:hypothetical protein